jgi:hypothetical protein
MHSQPTLLGEGSILSKDFYGVKTHLNGKMLYE